MQPNKSDINITPIYWLGEYYQNDGWKRLTLFHKKENFQGGSINTPIAEIDIVMHPGSNGCNSHCEIKFLIRNDFRREDSEIDLAKGTRFFRHVNEVVDGAIIEKAVEKLKENNLVSLPLSIYVCMIHVEDFKMQGDFWSDD